MDPSQTYMIVTVILVLLAMVCWFFSAQTWRWHTLTMVVLNSLAAIVFVYLGMRTLKTQREWRNKVRELENSIAKEDEISRGLLEGEEDANHVKVAGIEQLKADIDRATLGRGRVWRDLNVDSLQGLDVTLKPKEGESLSIPAKSIVFLFDERDEPRFLGEFTVKKADEKQVDLTLAAPSTQRERENLVNSAKKVIAYETMPVDYPEAYTEGKENKIRDALVAKLPPEIQAELKKKDRGLRDYTYLFEDLRRQMAILKAEADQSIREIEALRLAKTQGEAAVAAEDAEAKALAVDRARFQQESVALAAYAGQLDDKRKELIGQLNGIFAKNREMAQEIVSLNAKAINALNAHPSPSDEAPKSNEGKSSDGKAAESNKATESLLKAP